MLKQIPERITYAQEKLIALIKERKLRKWCIENNLQHAAIYRIALGEQNVSYRTACAVSHLIPPVEWLFYTDEPLPYEAQVVPQWNPENRCKFIKQHKYDYKEVAKKYGITELSAYNMCVVSRASPTLSFIKKCCIDTNPIDFFTDGEEAVKPRLFFPDRGDIVNIKENAVLVLSLKEDTEKDSHVCGVPVVKTQGEGFIALEGTKTKGFTDAGNIQTYILSETKCQANFIETVPASLVSSVLEKARNIFR